MVQGAGFERVLAIWRRRKGLAALAFAAPLAVTVGGTRPLPNIYQSTATVLVEHQQVAERFVRPSVTAELETRLLTITQEILSRSRLNDLIARFDLYPDLRRRAPAEAAIERMRRDIHVEFKEAQQRGGYGVTVAFALSYRGRDPVKVAQVTNALSGLFVEENVKIRERQTTVTAEFLGAQLDEAKRKLDEQARRINEFRERHMGELPEQQLVNLAALERLNAQLRLNSDRQLRALERREALVRQLADSVGPAAGPDAASAQLAKLRQALAELRTRFSDKYPDVARLKAEIAALERQLREAGDGREALEPAPPGPSPEPRPKDAPSQVGAELAALREEEQKLRHLIAAYERRIENAPRREQHYQQLARDYEAAKEIHQSLLKRYEEAQLAGTLEQHRQGEQFRILDPAIPSTLPVAPNRLRLLLVGLVGSFGLAVAAAALAETRDTSFHGVDELRGFTTVPVLGSVRPIVTRADLRRRWLRLGLVAATAMLALALLTAASYYLARDNEELVRLLMPGRFGTRLPGA